ncbi:tRNA pseudouridine(38-40) synthase TruA [Pseudokordiimonas caeni]|uniref:tRNA pseudouridine(38-40) synthase TruA n=1 Tax=Pseudokordiimonas caeni TaxID=2997908 RepID=UPI002811DC62|nr:tRNA pseudouridine(38-40) synthase TruA [Pseudokordiimonas caeni]
MARFKLTIEYDGRPYVGWQRQDNGPTVQAVLEDAFAEFAHGEEITVFGSGRTDAGVHAKGQVAHVDLARPMTSDALQAALNHFLKVRETAISILKIEEVGEDFNARFSAKGRHYLYRIVNRRGPLTFDRGLAWHVIRPLDAEAMNEAGQRLIGTHDFTTFRHVECQAKSPVKTLDYLRIERHGEEIHMLAGARSFLHHQIRSMIGTLELVGCGKWTADDVTAALEARDRSALGLNAPPDGLYFLRVDY